MSRCIYAITILCLFACDAWAVTPPIVDYANVVELVEQMKQHCPPQECIYVGVGRSPTFFTTALKLQAGTEVVDLPLSSFQYVLEREGSDWIGEVLTPQQREILFHHFDQYLPANLTNKKWLLIDYSMSGTSISSAGRHLEDYFNLHRKTPNQQLQHYIFTSQELDFHNVHTYLEARKIQNYHVVQLAPKFRDVEVHLYYSMAELYAVEGSFDITAFTSIAHYDRTWKRAANAIHNQEFARHMVQKISNDPALRRLFPLSCSAYYK